MAGSRSRAGAAASGLPFKTISSYAFDWIILIALGICAILFDKIEPNKRPFSLNDPNISFPYSEVETVPLWLLVVLCGIVPIIVIAVVSVVFVPGATVPRNTPKLMVWKRKLWELHVGWLGLALTVVSSTFFTGGMKNLFGKPRPDLLDRCQPDLENIAQHVAGGWNGENPLGLLYYASVCTQTDHEKLDDGFRSYPSGHSSASAAGLVYLSLFLASKFAVTIPFALPSPSSSHAAFPSRMNSASDRLWDDGSSAVNAKAGHAHNAKLTSIRRQAAAPPIYLLAIVLAPFCLSIFISSSRWYDYRHHGFDILFGYLMGLLTSIYSFRYYHLPIQEGAGWAWGPRSSDRAWWAGVGRLGYANDPEKAQGVNGQRGDSSDVDFQNDAHGPNHMMHRPTNGSMQPQSYPQQTAYGSNAYDEREFDDVEMGRMGHNPSNRRI